MKGVAYPMRPYVAFLSLDRFPKLIAIVKTPLLFMIVRKSNADKCVGEHPPI